MWFVGLIIVVMVWSLIKPAAARADARYRARKIQPVQPSNVIQLDQFRKKENGTAL